MYIFNPEHDLCIANGDIHFVPPESALAFGRDCASLVEFMQGLDLEADGLEKIVPWGWNSVLKNRLLKEGYDENLLPSESQIQQIIELSHRKVAIEALEFVHGSWKCGDNLAPSNYRIAAKSIKEIDDFLKRHLHIVLKAPLSGSGKGIRFVSEELSHSDAGWCRNLIARHGYVVVEQRFAPILEFAMLFKCSNFKKGENGVIDSNIDFIGYSLFYAQNGVYRGNILASNEFIENQISNYIPMELMERSRSAIIEFLKKKVAGKYEGFIGVDQFIYKPFIRKECCHFEEKGSVYRFNPVVEINMRMTMGLVARNIYDCFSSEYKLQDGSHVFEICRNEPHRGRYSYKIVDRLDNCEQI